MGLLRMACLSLALVWLLATNCFSDDLSQTTDANGNIIWTNAGPTQQEQQRREGAKEKSHINKVAEDIINRHPEMNGDQRLVDQFLQIRDQYVNSGMPMAEAMESAERYMTQSGDLVDHEALAEQRRLEAEQNARQASIDEYNRQETVRQSQEDQLIKKTSLEKQLLEQKWQSALKNCADSKNSNCREEKNKIYRKRIAKLEENPELYFYEQEKKQQIIHAQEVEDRQGGVIYDTNGNAYNRTAGGVIDARDGSFHPRSGNGYINSKTGLYMPAN